MKLVTAIIKPFKFDQVKDALQDAGVRGLTYTQVSGFGQQLGHTEVYRGREYQAELMPKARVEILAEDADVENLVEVLAKAAGTGSIGDGKIWVTPVDTIVRVRTGERDSAAV